MAGMRYQPQGRARIRQAGLGAKLVASVVGSQSQSGVLNRPITLAAGVSRVVTRHGVAFQHSASGGNVGFGVPGGLSTLIPIGTSFSVYMRLFVSALGVRQGLMTDHDAAGSNESYTIEITAANEWKASIQGGANAAVLAGVTTGWHDLLVVFRAGSGHQIYVDEATAGFLFAANLAAGSALRLGSFGIYPTLGFQGRTAVCHIFRGDVSDQFRHLSNNPWQVFEDASEDEDELAAAAVAPSITELTGGAAAVAAAFGALSTAIPLSGSAAAVAAGSGALSTSIRLAGAAPAVVSGAGVLSTSIRLTGTAGAVAAGTASMTTSVRLTGTAVAQASSSSTLATSISLSAAATASASVTGDLSAGAGLSGAASTVASAAGALATGIALSGSVAAATSATGGLSTGITLSGDATARSTGSASLSTAIPLAGSAVCAASVVADLNSAAAIALSGSAVAAASSTGALVTSIRLAGAVATLATAGGSLSTSIPLAGAAISRVVASGEIATSNQLGGRADCISAVTGSLSTGIALSGAARCESASIASLTDGIRYARAPAGPGYTPQRNESQSRPAAVGGSRPAATQRNYR